MVHLPSVSHIPQVPSVQLVPEVVTIASMPETAPQETLKDGLGNGQLQVTLSYSQASDSPLTAADVPSPLPVSVDPQDRVGLG